MSLCEWYNVVDLDLCVCGCVSMFICMCVSMYKCVCVCVLVSKGASVWYIHIFIY